MLGGARGNCLWKRCQVPHDKPEQHHFGAVRLTRWGLAAHWDGSEGSKFTNSQNGVPSGSRRHAWFPGQHFSFEVRASSQTTPDTPQGYGVPGPVFGVVTGFPSRASAQPLSADTSKSGRARSASSRRLCFMRPSFVAARCARLGAPSGPPSKGGKRARRFPR